MTIVHNGVSYQVSPNAMTPALQQTDSCCFAWCPRSACNYWLQGVLSTQEPSAKRSSCLAPALQVSVQPGPEGKRAFMERIKAIFNLEDEDQVQLTWGCKVPGSGEPGLALKGRPQGH
jgi:hypothetical protein